MKRIILEYRQPNVDRFLEIMLLMVVSNLNVTYSFCIKNMPRAYGSQILEMRKWMESFLKVSNASSLEKELNLANFQITLSKNSPMFICEYPEHYSLSVRGIDTRMLEPIDAIVSRVGETLFRTHEVSTKLSDVSLNLLKLSANKIEMNADDCQAVMDIAMCIALLDASVDVRPEHIAEAVHYIHNSTDKHEG